MYKKLVLLLTFIVSFIVSINVVSAAQELTCIYEDGIMVKQYLNGKQEIYINDSKETDAFSSDWKLANNFTVDLKIYSRYIDSSNNKLMTTCPYCANKKSKKVILRDGVDEDYLPGENCITGDKSLVHKYNSTSTSSIENENTSKRTICNYVNKKAVSNSIVTAELIYDDTSVSITGGLGNPVVKFDYDKLMETVNENNKCPSKIYSTFQSNIPDKLLKLQTEEFYLTKLSTNYTYELTNIVNPGEESIYNEKTKKNETYEDTNDPCELIGSDAVDIINEVMKIIRIIVPILLLIFGITDFFKGVFSGSADDMTKYRNTFFKRLLAAIIVFIVPVFVNLVLGLANQVWSNINKETCIK